MHRQGHQHPFSPTHLRPRPCRLNCCLRRRLTFTAASYAHGSIAQKEIMRSLGFGSRGSSANPTSAPGIPCLTMGRQVGYPRVCDKCSVGGAGAYARQQAKRLSGGNPKRGVRRLKIFNLGIDFNDWKFAANIDCSTSVHPIFRRSRSCIWWLWTICRLGPAQARAPAVHDLVKCQPGTGASSRNRQFDFRSCQSCAGTGVSRICRFDFASSAVCPPGITETTAG